MEKSNRSGGLFLSSVPTLFILALFLSSCAPISRTLRQEAAPLSLREVSQNPEAYKGKIVIWGGEIIGTVNQKDNTTLIEVLQRPLDWMEEPERSEPSEGRFLVLVEHYLDPYIYRRERTITVAGEILGERRKPLGEMDYRYPLVLSKQIHLWRGYYYYYGPPYYPWPYYGPGWWYYGPWGYPYWW